MHSSAPCQPLFFHCRDLLLQTLGDDDEVRFLSRLSWRGLTLPTAFVAYLDQGLSPLDDVSN